MVLFKGLQKYSGVFYLVMFFSSVSYAATNESGLPYGTISPVMHSPVDTVYHRSDLTFNRNGLFNVDAISRTEIECSTGNLTNSINPINDPEQKNKPAATLSECIKETFAISLHKDGDKTIWSVAPSLAKFSLNPIDNIKNIHVLFQYNF